QVVEEAPEDVALVRIGQVVEVGGVDAAAANALVPGRRGARYLADRDRGIAAGDVGIGRQRAGIRAGAEAEVHEASRKGAERGRESRPGDLGGARVELLVDRLDAIVV